MVFRQAARLDIGGVRKGAAGELVGLGNGGVGWCGGSPWLSLAGPATGDGVGLQFRRVAVCLSVEVAGAVVHERRFVRHGRGRRGIKDEIYLNRKWDSLHTILSGCPQEDA